VYVLGELPQSLPKAARQTTLPIVEVKRVLLPDYLDGTAILERRGNQLVPSATSRWGERLSVGITRALASSLAARLPGAVVTATPLAERPYRQVLVDVGAFESTAGHEVVLVARWTIADTATRRALASEQTYLVRPVEIAGDRGIVTAMSQAIDDLAAQVATRLEHHTLTESNTLRRNAVRP
jgi:uncharacterized lipoprotein YmbA